jgi:tellurite resistance protein
MKLPKESFVALAAVTWADGRMSRNEAEGLLRAARAAGLDGADLDDVQKATKERTEVSDADLTGLTPWERGLTYALAGWLARVDGVENAAESEALRKLGAALDLPQDKLDSAAAGAFDVACLPSGHRPEKYDFDALEERLRARLPSLTKG